MIETAAYLAFGLLIGAATLPWRRRWSPGTGTFPYLLLWACFSGPLLLLLAWQGLKAYARAWMNRA